MKNSISLKDDAKDTRCLSSRSSGLFSGRKSAVLIACCALVLYSSCKKNNSAPNWKIPMIKTETTNNATITYWYDEKGRIVKAESGDWLRTDFTYSPDSVYYKTTELATNVVQKNVGKLNANGRILYIDGTEYVYDASDRLSETFFPVQSNGWQVRKRNHYNSTTGLLDSTRQTESRLLQTRWLQTTTYTYYTDLAETHGFENKGSGLWGQNDLHPMKHSESWAPIALAPFRKIVYTVDKNYGYDEAGRIVVEDHRETRPDNSAAQWRTVYTYY